MDTQSVAQPTKKARRKRQTAVEMPVIDTGCEPDAPAEMAAPAVPMMRIHHIQEQPLSEIASIVAQIASLAANPDVDVAKLQAVADFVASVRAADAKSKFIAAFARMQKAMPTVDKRGKITARDEDGGGPQRKVRNKYARYGEDILTVVKPITADHGFALMHTFEWPPEKPGIIRVIATLLHEAGHSEQSTFEAPADTHKSRNDIQSKGSTLSYGERYTAIGLLNITQVGVDDDGESSGPRGGEPQKRQERPAPPILSAEDGEKPITRGTPERPAGQLEKLVMAFRTSGRTEHEVATWLAAKYEANSMKEVKRKDFDAIIRALESPGPLTVE